MILIEKKIIFFISTSQKHDSELKDSSSKISILLNLKTFK